MITPLVFKTSVIYISLIIIAYLIGSVSSAILLCYTFKLPDPRKYGSNNPGTTNVLRLAGKKMAASVLLLDVLKGFLVVWFARQLLIPDYMVVAVALSVFLGQLFPIFFGFKGGKGVAVTLGIILALYWPLALLLVTSWLLIFIIFRISSLASLGAIAVAIIITTVSMVWFPEHRYFALGIMSMALMILLRHTKNIKNLLNKTENKIKI